MKPNQEIPTHPPTRLVTHSGQPASQDMWGCFIAVERGPIYAQAYGLTKREAEERAGRIAKACNAYEGKEKAK